MKTASLIMFLGLFTASAAHAAASYSSSSSSSPHSISAALGFMNPGANVFDGSVNGRDVDAHFDLSGFLGLGADYDYQDNKDYSFGGIFRYYTANGSHGGVSYKNQMIVLGPDFKGYITSEFWYAYFGVGFEYLSPSYSAGGTSVSINNGFGVSMSLGFMHNITPTMAIGMESLRIMGLSGSINGTPVEDYMFKMRFQL
jgi:hypothetical protein